MSEWFEFSLYAVKEFVLMVFNWDLDLGFSVGDFCLACSIIGIVVTALVVKSAHISSGIDAVSGKGLDIRGRKEK